MAASEKTEKRMPKDIKAIRKEVFETVSESERRLTPGELEKRLSQKLTTDKKALKTAIRNLVEDRELVYTYNFGCSFLEKSFNRPTQISKRIVLKPPGSFYRPLSDEVVIELQHGASFGSGEHPSTRLAVRGIEQALSKKEFLRQRRNIHALDIGTGSGVLAIVSVMLGAKSAVGIDIDPCARAEAKENVKLNNLENLIEIQDRKVEKISQKFSLITANLRFPTLKRLCPHITEVTEKGGSVVISGIKTGEVSNLLKIYTQNYFRCVWKEFEKDWAGLLFISL
jgi:ribosomal protein L11 methyltransferase